MLRSSRGDAPPCFRQGCTDARAGTDAREATAAKAAGSAGDTSGSTTSARGVLLSGGMAITDTTVEAHAWHAVLREEVARATATRQFRWMAFHWFMSVRARGFIQTDRWPL